MVLCGPHGTDFKTMWISRFYRDLDHNSQKCLGGLQILLGFIRWSRGAWLSYFRDELYIVYDVPGCPINFIILQATMDESRNHYDNYCLNTMQADQHTGQSLPSTFNPAEHLWFANSENALDSSPLEEKQQRIYLSPSEESQIGNESLSFPPTGTLLPSPADLDLHTSPACFLETWVDAFDVIVHTNPNIRMYQDVSQQLGALNQKLEGVEM